MPVVRLAGEERLLKGMSGLIQDKIAAEVFIYRDNYYNKFAKDNDIKFIVAKGRCEYKVHSPDYDKFKRKASIQGE